MTYGTSYTVDQTYSKGTTVMVGDTTYVFSGWTASNDQAWVSSNGVDGTVKGIRQLDRKGADLPSGVLPAD